MLAPTAAQHGRPFCLVVEAGFVQHLHSRRPTSSKTFLRSEPRLVTHADNVRHLPVGMLGQCCGQTLQLLALKYLLRLNSGLRSTLLTGLSVRICQRIANVNIFDSTAMTRFPRTAS